MSVIKAVLFDLDDTLWSIVPVIRRAEGVLFDWLQRHAPDVASRVSLEEMRRKRQQLMATDPVYQIDLRALRHAVLTDAFRSVGADVAMVDRAMEVFSRARNEVTPFDDVLPALASLRSKVALGAVSNGVADLQAIGIAHFFGTAIAAHRFGSAKPDPAIFRAACDELQVMPNEAVYVGDDPILDVEGAQKAGLRAVWMRREELETERELPPHVQPEMQCSNLFELERWLDDKVVRV